MGIKFIHFSDTHLGFSDLDILDSNGKNIREEDVYSSFASIVDYIIQENPDFVIHSGDIFHRSSPTNRPLIVAAQQLQRIASAGIPFYMIAGNHDYPKSVLTSPIHDLYTLNDHINIIHSEKLEVIETDKYVLHLLPHINGEQKFLEEANKLSVTNKEKPNILSMHVSMPSFLMNEYGERVYPVESIKLLKDFDYVALGHWHRYNHLVKYGNVFYSGSTERTSDSQTGYNKGFLKVSINQKTEVEFIPLKLRTFEKIKIDNCYEKKSDDIINEIKNNLNSRIITGGIFHIQLNELPAAEVNRVPRDVFEEIFEDALFFRISKTIKDSDETIEIDSETNDLKVRFLEELNSNFDAEELTKVSELSKRLWEEIEEEDADANS